MRTLQLSNFKKLFEEQLKRLTEKRRVSIESFGVSPEETIDALDHARDQAEQFVRMEMHNREQAVLTKTRQALLRIRDGVFGVCVDCEGDIELKRLEAKPTANLCLECQRQQEQESNQLRQSGLHHARAFRLQIKPA